MHIIRWIARRFTDLGLRGRPTFGQIASMSHGPCERCVGHAVFTLSESPPSTLTGGNTNLHNAVEPPVEWVKGT